MIASKVSSQKTGSKHGLWKERFHVAWYRVPTELLLEIAKHLESQAWLNAFARTNQHTFSIMNPYLHRYNADYQQHSALAFGDISAKIGSIIPTSDEGFHTPICYALQHGQTRVLGLLLNEYGADIEQHCCKSMTPLNYAAGLGKLEFFFQALHFIVRTTSL
ncbi:uncharacterized protein CDV56_100499 [Aspergillus thermomutatus]|uniref:Uncharacterized protein n=1 Tax=Aspergillus thermomutatus TaxID=41047 RepID=A0A397G3P1_ASPTH|nr:uncharacterized protein CDV56_100499 [Aspergillus thermomutatus]RHZ45641.1 hypothetical protein CDV56_100499 [Aspergillus thermomutatus]